MKQDNDAVLNAPGRRGRPDTYEKVTSATTTANKRGLRGDDWSHDFQYHHQYAIGIPHCQRAACIMALSKKTNENLSVARVNGQKKRVVALDDLYGFSGDLNC